MGHKRKRKPSPAVTFRTLTVDFTFRTITLDGHRIEVQGAVVSLPILSGEAVFLSRDAERIG